MTNPRVRGTQAESQMEISSRTVAYEIHCDASADPGELKLINELSMCECATAPLASDPLARTLAWPRPTASGRRHFK